MPSKQKKADSLAHYMLRSVNKAVRDSALIAEGDRILVAVSGGEDSLTLLDLLQRRQRSVREHYELVAARLQSDYHCGAAVSTAYLAEWCQSRGIPLVLEQLRVAHELEDSRADPCFRCSWNRRKALFLMADRLGCNKVALGHQMDDRVETALMNLFFSGRFQSMEPCVPFFGGRLTVIRPLIYIEERGIVAFSQASGYPIEGSPCPAGLASKRAVVRQLLRALESQNRDVKRSIVGALSRAQASAMAIREGESNPLARGCEKESREGVG